MKSLSVFSFLVVSISLTLGVLRGMAASAAGVGIELDGKPICGFTVTWDDETDAELWMLLKTHPLTLERDFKMPVDPGDDTAATVRGEIEIFTKLRGNVQVGAKTDRLRFVRRGGRWYLSEEDIMRTLELAGLPVPESEKDS